MADRTATTSLAFRAPWALLLAGATALAALLVTIVRESTYQDFIGFMGIPVLGALLLASRAIPWRLPNTRLVAWIVRAAVFGTMVAVVGIPQESVAGWYMKPEYTNLVGYLLGAELVIRAYGRVAPGKYRETLGVTLVLTALIITGAANTYDRPHMQLLVPIYICCVALSLRSFRPNEAGTTRRPLSQPLLTLRLAALLAVLAVGFLEVYWVTKYEGNLTTWAVRLLQQKFGKREEIGLSGRPQLMEVQNPEPSMRRVLLIDGPQSDRHLRALAFDTYEDGRWGPSAHDRIFQAVDLHRGSTTQPAQGLHITRLADTDDLLLLPLEAARVDAGVSLQRDPAGCMRDVQAGANESYDLLVPTAAGSQGPLCVPPTADQRQRLLAIPPDLDPRVIELARRVAGTRDAQSRVFNLQQHLQATHAYSLSYKPQGNALNDFILNGRSAHCQYFASAMVMLSRSAGVPARLVTGFYAHEPYGDNQIVVRDRDAHAWVECWIDNVGWVTIDPTPAIGRPDGLFPQPPKWRHAWEHILDIPRTIWRALAALGWSRTLSVVAVPLLVALGVWSVSKLRARRKKRRDVVRTYAAASPQLAQAASEFEQWLRRRGIELAPDRTWREILSSPGILEKEPVALPTCFSFVDAYDEARFGGDHATAKRVQEILQSLGAAGAQRRLQKGAE